MDMTSYMHQTEQAIASAFVNDKLAVHLLGGVQGPHTLTYAIRLYQPTKSNVAKALALAPAIEAHTGLSPVRVYSDQGAILVEVPSPEPVIVYGRTLRGDGVAVPLGMTSRRAITGVDFAINPHLLFVGPTGRGKTTAARAVVYHLTKQNTPSQARFVVSTFKPKDWRAFAGLTHCMAVVTDPAESAAMINWLLNLMYVRTRNETDTPHLFVFLDDLLNLLSCADVADQLGEIASLGRGAGIHLIIGTQRLNEKGSGNSTVTGNITTRLVFGTASAQDASTFAGRGETGAEKLGRYPGDALLLTDGSTQRLAVALVTDDDLESLPKNGENWRPWKAVQQKLQCVNSVSTDTRSSVSDTAIRHTTNTLENGAFDGNFDTRAGRVSTGNFSADTPIATRVTSVATRLPDAEPTPDEQEYLRMLFVKLGSKRAVMRAAWSGVVGDDGNSHRTRRWLDEALGSDEL